MAIDTWLLGVFGKSSDCAGFRSFSEYFLCCRSLEWLRGLDGGPETGIACLDGSLAFYPPNYKHKSGS